MSANSNFRFHKNCKPQQQYKRSLHMEALEERALLSVNPWSTDTGESLPGMSDPANTVAAIAPQTVSYDYDVELSDDPGASPNTFTAYATPEGYNSHDYQKLIAFFEQTDSNGVKNGTKCFPSYDPARPGNFTGRATVTWYTYNGERRLKQISIPSGLDLIGNMDISDMPYLEYLNFSSNNVSTLDVSGCTVLQSIYCESNQLVYMNLTGCTTLNTLHCSDNLLTSIDVSSCTNLGNFRCSSNRLTSLNVSNLTKLGDLQCQSNNMKEFNASGCTSLSHHHLYLDDNPLEKINHSGCTGLSEFHYIGTPSSYKVLKELNVSGCTNLTYIYCYYGQMTSLNVSGCTALNGINCSYNQFSSLDLRGVSLHELSIAGNPQLSQVFLTNNDIKNLTVYFDHSIACGKTMTTPPTIHGTFTLLQKP